MHIGLIDAVKLDLNLLQKFKFGIRRVDIHHIALQSRSNINQQ
jgi:hypothetical protein